VISSLDKAVADLSRCQASNSVVWFAFFKGGFHIKGYGIITQSTEESLKFPRQTVKGRRMTRLLGDSGVATSLYSMSSAVQRGISIFWGLRFCSRSAILQSDN
jgi:hypothetical protein